MLLPFVIFLLTAYGMLVLNNTYALIRIYSRMVSCSFLVLACMASFATSSWRIPLLGLVSVLAYILLFRCYQDRSAQGWVFYAFVCIGIGSLSWVQMLYFVPLAWLVCAFCLYCLDLRTFIASVFGVAFPYWFWAGWLAIKGNMAPLLEHFEELITFGHIMESGCITNHHLAMLLFIIVTAIIGSLHFVSHSYQDKIRTRMFFQCFMFSAVYAFVFLVLQPQFASQLLIVMTVMTAPIIGHYFALSNSKASNILFFVMLAVAIAIIAFNLWTPSRIYF